MAKKTFGRPQVRIGNVGDVGALFDQGWNLTTWIHYRTSDIDLERRSRSQVKVKFSKEYVKKIK